MTELMDLDATTLTAGVTAGTIKVVDIAEAVIRRVEQRQPDVQAFAYFDPDLVRDRARLLDAVPRKGPLHGVPIGVKDVIQTFDMPTTHNSPRYANSRARIDAACVETLRAAGALIVGKTVTTEFAATLRGGVTRNPRRLAHTPGGSSSGSAAAVADNQIPLALGTQTGGSTIRPASFCGVFGWKPTWSAISREGLKMSSTTLDTLGLYARTAADLALLADVFDIDAATDPLPQSLSGLKVGICRTPLWEKAGEATKAAMREAIDLLRAAGVTVSDIVMPGEFDLVPQSHRFIARREGRAAFLNEYRTTQSLHDDFKATVENRAGVTPEQVRTAYRHADRCRAIWEDIASAYDFVITPSAVGEAPLGLDSTGDASFNSIWTLMHVPVVNVPGLVGPTGLPVGVSLTARRYEDRKVIAVAGLVSRLFAFRDAMAAE